MKQVYFFVFVTSFVSLFGLFFSLGVLSERKIVYEKSEFEDIDTDDWDQTQAFCQVFGLCDWQRPEGPLKVALQVGHWKNHELPDELERLRGVSTGTSGGGKQEWEVCLQIAKLVAQLLEAYDIEVDIIPATVPPLYYADLFIAIHADGNRDTSISGFKASGPYRDVTGKSPDVVRIFEQEYAKATNMPLDYRITPNMRGYYAFNWRKYSHSIHPMTTAVIVETGFLTNKKDQKILIHEPHKAAQGIANTVITYFNL